jgi:3-oxoacyl-[acyl-carrier protein] reductase
MTTDTTAIITGASSGIGRAIAERLAADGIRLGLLGRDPVRLAEAADATDAIAAERADVTDRPALTAALDRIRNSLGRVDTLITAAGGTGHVDTGQEPGEAAATWREVVDRNLTGTFYTVLALARHLPRPGGRVITLSSIASATGGSAGALAYATAKAGTDGFTRALSSELGPHGIAVNAIAPGYVAGTRFFGEGDQAERRERFARLIPSGRVGEPADIADLVSFLCRPEADHIRGQILHVNGGQYLAG